MDLVLLHSSNSCVKKGFQSTIYIASTMQNALVVSIKEKVIQRLLVCHLLLLHHPLTSSLLCLLLSSLIGISFHR